MSDVNKPRRPEGIPPRDFPNKPNPPPFLINQHLIRKNQ